MNPKPTILPTVLVAEAEAVTMEIISAILKDAGYQVLGAGNGQQCMDMAIREPVDLILMDVSLPVMGGLEACRQINSDTVARQIPVVFITTETDDATLEAAFQAGGQDYVRKPVGRVELLARIERVLARQHAARRMAEDEKLKGLLETAGAVCHKLNQPLQYMLGALQIQMMDMSPQDPLHANLDKMREKVEQMGVITRKLAEVTRYRTGDR